MKSVPEFYGELVFNYHEMSKRLSPQVYEHFRQAISGDYKVLLDLELANKMASAMQEWALEKGATHYTHWFHPMTGLTAEKHESFIHTRNDGTVIMKFTGKELVKGETDGSSFPSGGLRSTFEARGYTAWDASAFAFIRNGTLYIPTVFLAYNGEVLDRKTPLHRSSSVVKEQTKRLLDLLGYPTQHVRVTVGAEQEYFLIPKEVFQQRLDLKLTGRTLFGARSPKTHELEDHYYGNIKPKIINFMSQLDKEL
jgi:glutamine synthetase